MKAELFPPCFYFPVLLTRSAVCGEEREQPIFFCSNMNIIKEGKQMQIRFLTGQVLKRNQQKNVLCTERRAAWWADGVQIRSLFSPGHPAATFIRTPFLAFPLEIFWHLSKCTEDEWAFFSTSLCELLPLLACKDATAAAHTGSSLSLSLLWIYLHISIWRGSLPSAAVDTFR